MKIKTSLCAGAALGVMLLGAGVAQAQDTTVAWKGAPQWTNDDVQFKVRGRVLLDAVFEDVDRETGADQNFRAFRGRQVFLGVEGKLNNYIAYKVEGGWVNGGTPAWDDVVIEVKPNDMTSVMFGNIKAAGLENLTSTRFTTFMDRGPFGDFGVDSYLVSAVAKVNGANWTLTGAVQGDSLNSADVTAGEERLGFTGRASYAPILTDATKLHLAASYRVRDHGDESGFSYQSRPNTNFGSRYISTGAIGDKDRTLAVEGAFVHNNFSMQGEYARISVDRLSGGASAGGDPDLDVGYVFASFWPTGEMRNYDATKGEFGRPKILNPITAGGFGGVEIALRYDWADLTDAYSSASTAASRALSQDAGEYKAWTLGVNYYPTSYVRFQANYTKGENDNPVVGRDVDVDVFQMRAQLDF
jgi:phosphate-selective porin OprO/OprP